MNAWILEAIVRKSKKIEGTAFFYVQLAYITQCSNAQFKNII
jgi:hypothetical protein